MSDEREKIENSMELYNYSVRTLTITCDGESMDIEPKNVLSFSIIKAFDEKLYPVFMLNLVVDFRTYYNIIENTSNILVNLDISSYSKKRDEEIGDVSKFYNPVIKGAFKIINSERDPFLTEEFYKKDPLRTENGEKAENHQDENRNITLFLFNPKLMKPHAILKDGIFESADILGVLYYYLTDVNCDVLFQEPDNIDTISNFVIPYGNIISTISHFAKLYGIYNNGIMLFQDFDTLYLHDCKPCNVFRKKELKNVLLKIDSYGVDNLDLGVFRDKENDTIVVNNVNDFSIMSQSAALKDIFGSEVRVINPFTQKVSNISPEVEADKFNDSFQVIHDLHNNKYWVNSYKKMMKENNRIINMMFADIDILDFTPNKVYIAKFSNPENQKNYGGRYRLSYVSFDFNKVGPNDFNVACEGKFKIIE